MRRKKMFKKPWLFISLILLLVALSAAQCGGAQPTVDTSALDAAKKAAEEAQAKVATAEAQAAAAQAEAEKAAGAGSEELKAAKATAEAAVAEAKAAKAEAEAAKTAAEPAAEPVTLNILVEGGGFQLQEAIAKKFEAETGNKVNFVQVPYAQVFEKLAAEMATGGASFDVATIDVIWIPAFAKFAEPLDDLFTDEVKGDLFPSLVADAQYNGKFVGMPTWANAEILFYRKDLFEDSAEQAAFKAKYGYDLKVPETWQEFTDVAQFFTRDSDGDGKIDLYGTDVKGLVETEWLAHVLQAGSPGVVLDANKNIIIDNKEHVAALKFYTDLHCKYKVNPPNVNEVDWNVAQNLFYQGQTAMMRFWAHAYRLTPEDSKIQGKVGVAPMIAGSGGIGAIPGPWYNIIPTTSANKEVAKQFVQFAYQNNALGIEAPLGLAARTSAYGQYAYKPGFEHFDALIKTLNAPQTIGRPLVENWQEITDEVLIPLVQEALTCKTSPEEVLANARTKIEQMQ
jgi:ABC-type glycerol-3-phosphate transport system substrate-binding protein